MENANERQVAGTHYNSVFQHWDFVEETGLDYIPAQITRYLARWRKKNGEEDIEKSLHYMDKFIEAETHRASQIIDTLNDFINENNLQEHERIVFNMLVHYRLGDLDRLYEARNAIIELLKTIRGTDA